MERRSYATFKNTGPIKNCCYLPCSRFEEYPNDLISVEKLINMMVGDLQEDKIISKRFPVYRSFWLMCGRLMGELVDMGFDKQLVKWES